MTRPMPSVSRCDEAIDAVLDACAAARAGDAARVVERVRHAASVAWMFVDVAPLQPSPLRAWRAVQEYLLVAAKALCTCREPPSLRPDHAADAFVRAEAALQAAHEIAAGRRAA